MTARNNLSISEMLLWSINELSDVYADQIAVFHTPLNCTTPNLGMYTYMYTNICNNFLSVSRYKFIIFDILAYNKTTEKQQCNVQM